MKKFSILALAALLVVALALPAAALENEFGGYWRTRFVNEGHFDGEDDDAGSYRYVDTRTRLYYTAKINDNLKLVNKFEMDAVWGESQYRAPLVLTDSNGDTVVVPRDANSLYGDPGADGVRVEVKNSYADFNLGPVNFTVGVQPYYLFRAFYIDNDDAGIIARWKVLPNFVLAGSWLKAYEGGIDGGNNSDVDSYTLGAGIWFSENISIKPAISYARSSELDALYAAGTLTYEAAVGTINPLLSPGPYGELELLTYGFDFDMDFDNFGLWVTLIGQDGSLDSAIGNDIDISAWLAAIGGNVMLGPVDLHGQFFYTPGDDDALDSDIDNFFASQGSYYWAEILGYGIFDRTVPNGSPADKIYNIWAANIGATFKPMDKLSITADLWYAEREEDLVFTNPITGLPFGEGELGTELDVKVTYQLVEGLNLDLVGAYLWAGDAVSVDGNNDEDPYEIGARLSLSF